MQPTTEDQSALKRKEPLTRSVTWMTLRTDKKGNSQTQMTQLTYWYLRKEQREGQGQLPCWEQKGRLISGEWTSGILEKGGVKWPAMHLMPLN